MYSAKAIIVFPILISAAQCLVNLDASKQFHPVHGLYVKPSSDGTTGDLYVAASEDSGVKSQWFTDQPVNFLTAASQIKSKSVPASFTSSLKKSTTPNEETITSKKRAIITSPPLKYAYAMPIPSAEAMSPFYPIIPRTKSSEEFVPAVPCSKSIPAHPYFPYSYFYPHMMSALANAMKAVKENEGSEEGSAGTPQSTPYWPQAYSYPYQYVMVDPSAWTHPQANASPPSQQQVAKQCSLEIQK